MNPNPKQKPLRLKGKARTDFRRQLCNRANARCERCGQWAPLLDDGVFNKFTCGHVRHKISRGAGGEDTFENCDWWCWDCHNGHDHSPKWSKKKPQFTLSKNSDLIDWGK